MGPVARPQRVLLITDSEFLRRAHHDTVTVLPMSPLNRRADSEIRVRIHCRANKGTAVLDCDHWVAIDGLMPMDKGHLIVQSGTEIHELEKKAIRAGLKNYLGLQ